MPFKLKYLFKSIWHSINTRCQAAQQLSKNHSLSKIFIFIVKMPKNIKIHFSNLQGSTGLCNFSYLLKSASQKMLKIKCHDLFYRKNKTSWTSWFNGRLSVSDTRFLVLFPTRPDIFNSEIKFKNMFSVFLW